MMPSGAFMPEMTGPGGTFCLAEGSTWGSREYEILESESMGHVRK